jgi:hypothetical protein
VSDDWEEVERLQAEEMTAWEKYWNSLSEQERARERRMMDEHRGSS